MIALEAAYAMVPPRKRILQLNKGFKVTLFKGFVLSCLGRA